jgi:hypothetical protein
MVSTFYGTDHSTVDGPGIPAEIPAPQRLNAAQKADLIAGLHEWVAAGLLVHPARANGSKNPVSVEGGSHDTEPDLIPETWSNGKPRENAGQPNPRAGQHGFGYGRIRDGLMPRLTVEQITAMIRQGRADGIGVFCGSPSNGLEMVEVEARGRVLLQQVAAAAERLGATDLLQRLFRGCVQESASGGVHFLLFVIDCPSSEGGKLAYRNGADGPELLAEFHGNGRWFIAAPSAGRTHKTGKAYRLLRGSPSTIPTFTLAERNLIYDCFRAVSEMPKADRPDRKARPARQRREGGPLTPADDYNRQTKWDELLLPAGWTKVGSPKQRRLDGGGTEPVQTWCRPGKKGATSATTTPAVLWAFTSSTVFPERQPLTKFSVYAHLHHLREDGTPDYAAAARVLAEKGYGDDVLEHGTAPVVVEQMAADDGDHRSLSEWRVETAAERALAVDRPGLHLDRSPTGSGKTYSTVQAMKRVSSSLTALPTHANVVERVREMQDAGVPAVAFPEMNHETCRNYSEASQAQKMGLIAGAAVCPGCPFQKGCLYQQQVKEAERAAHRVCTHERLRLSRKVTEGVAAINVDEMLESVLAPSISVSVGDLAAVANLAREVVERWDSHPSPDESAFANALMKTYRRITTAAEQATAAGFVDVEIENHGSDPKTWQPMLHGWITKFGVRDLTELGQQRFSKALDLLTRATTGGLETLRLVVEQTNRHKRMPDGSVVESAPLHHFAVGSWKTPLPDVAVFLTDATTDPDDLRAAVGRDLEDHTPTGRLPYQQPVTQIVVDVTKGQQAATVAGLVDDFLTAHPDVKRLGVIGHQTQVRETFEGDGLLPSGTRDRVAKWAYFGEGPDRGSNDWHGACDHLLVVGTPRCRAGVLREWLVRHGLHDAAGLPSGDWGPRHWEAVTTDGTKVVVEGKGYRHPDWHRAARAMTRAALQQAVGRGRAILTGGIPVTIISDEPCGVPVDESLEILTSSIRETVQAVRDARDGRVAEPEKSPTGVSVGRFSETAGRVRVSAVVAVLTETYGIGRRAAEIRLAAAVKAGRLEKPSKGWLSVVGDEMPALAPAVVVQAAPAPAAAVTPPTAITPPPQAVVIHAAGPVDDHPPVQVAAVPTPETTTCVSTSQVSPPRRPSPDDLLEQIDERAAIMEHDGHLGQETADRLAHEMLMGRGVTTPIAPAETVGVDHSGLAARFHPFVEKVVERLPGTVSVVGHDAEPFGRKDSRQSRLSGACVCGSTAWCDVPIHGGASVRRDCARCDRFLDHPVWYGKVKAGSPDEGQAAPVRRTPAQSDRISFLSPAPVGHPLLPVG